MHVLLEFKLKGGGGKQGGIRRTLMLRRCFRYVRRKVCHGRPGRRDNANSRTSDGASDLTKNALTTWSYTKYHVRSHCTRGTVPACTTRGSDGRRARMRARDVMCRRPALGIGSSVGGEKGNRTSGQQANVAVLAGSGDTRGRHGTLAITSETRSPGLGMWATRGRTCMCPVIISVARRTKREVAGACFHRR